MASGYRETEDLEITRVERLLLVGLVVFLLIGGLWVLDQMEGIVPQPRRPQPAGAKAVSAPHSRP